MKTVNCHVVHEARIIKPGEVLSEELAELIDGSLLVDLDDDSVSPEVSEDPEGDDEGGEDPEDGEQYPPSVDTGWYDGRTVDTVLDGVRADPANRTHYALEMELARDKPRAGVLDELRP